MQLGWASRVASKLEPNTYSKDPVAWAGQRANILESSTWEWRQAQYEVKLFGPQGRQRRLAHGRLLVDPQLVR